MERLPRGYVLGIFGVATVSYFSRNDLPAGMDWRDYTAFAVWGLLLWWCFSPRRDASLAGADGHEETRQGFAFRLGKSLNRIRGRLRS